MEKLFENFLEVIRAVTYEYYATPNDISPTGNSLWQMPEIIFTKGPKYWRIVRQKGPKDRSVYGFVRREDGAIFRAASWKAPDVDHVKGFLHNYHPSILGAYGIGGETGPSYGVKNSVPESVKHLLPV